VAPDGMVWFTGNRNGRLVKLDPASRKLTKMRRFTLPEGARPRRLVVTGDAIWYGDYARGYLGRLDPATGKVGEFAMPAGAGSLPYAMAGDRLQLMRMSLGRADLRDSTSAKRS
jgi:virginiamycin B lyase